MTALTHARPSRIMGLGIYVHNAHNTPVGRRAVLTGGHHVKGYSKHG